MVERILFTRHGETEDNLINRLSTSPPGPNLTSLGIKQAEDLRSNLLNTKINIIFTSPLTRARQTAEVVKGDRKIDIIDNYDLRELSVGNYEGRNDPEVFEELDKIWKKWTVDGKLNTKMGKGGESANEVLYRGKNVIKNILTSKNISGTALVVAHSGILQLLVPSLCSNLSNNFGVINWIRNCQLIETVVNNNYLECQKWGNIKI